MAGASAARAVAAGVGRLVAMAGAVVVGVWAGALGALGQDARQRSPFTWWMVNRLMFLAAATSIQGFAPYFLMYAFCITREAAAEMTGNLMMVFAALACYGVLFILSTVSLRWVRAGSDGMPQRLSG